MWVPGPWGLLLWSNNGEVAVDLGFQTVPVATGDDVAGCAGSGAQRTDPLRSSAAARLDAGQHLRVLLRRTLIREAITCSHARASAERGDIAASRYSSSALPSSSQRRCVSSAAMRSIARCMSSCLRSDMAARTRAAKALTVRPGPR